MPVDVSGQSKYELAKDVGAEAERGRIQQYTMTIANKNVDEIKDKLDALTGAINAASGASSALGDKMRCLTWALVVATVVGATATVVLAVAAFR